MKTTFLIITFVLTGPAFTCQTRFYFPRPDGSKDPASYRELIEHTGLVITHDANTRYKRDSAPNFRLIFDGDSINCEFKNLPDIVGELGWITKDKKIVDLAVPLHGKRTPSAYIRDSKIYSLDHKLLGYIEGKMIYGVGLYLLHE